MSQQLTQAVPQMAISASTQELATLIDEHLGALRAESPSYRVADSPISGRGIFALRDIAKGELIFREHTLLVGPTAHRGRNLRTCTQCYGQPPGDSDASALCPAGCGLPVCGNCASSTRHTPECQLFRKWQPKEATKAGIEPQALRILSVVRCFFLNEPQRKLLYAMQANADRYYIREVERAAECFEQFPRDPELLEYFYRTVCAFNTNAFESRFHIDGQEVVARALFPLAGLLNHQCTPNAAHHFEDGETIVVTATERIPMGAEITMSYAKLLWSTLARKMFLGMTKHFMCRCPRCQDPTMDVVNPLSLRILTAVRVFYLSKEQRALVDAMQANAERGYRQEIIKAAQCFRKFPTTDKPFMDQLFRVVGVLNTNAFEAPCRVDTHETLLRGLFPLTAIMNHECTPNASHYFENGRLAVVRAARAIPKGGEITTTYTKILWSNLTRGIFLKMTKYFVCNCDRCNDNSENGTYLAALFCREQGCKGLVIPVQTKTLQPDWRCLSCENVFPHSKMARYQDFALNTINNRINTCSVRDMIHFINDLCPRFCPPSNYVLIEAKLNVIWRMTRLGAEEYSPEELAHKDRYREEILAILHKLGAGECTLKKLINEEIK
ncbi:GH12314 [Drosophila grimshawi]|uniref:GH12314 n=1 Tax=Drosophila grimshawi TaxID=7222 RepID=B4JJ76_DROGR|nr:GH12314 [Drosophila grimshawi]